MAIVYILELDSGQRVGKVELLSDAIVLVNGLSPLLQDIHMTAINLVVDHVAHMLQLVHPG